MADLKSLKEIFNNSVFRIPDYQRGYAWTEPQIIDFWNDLVNLVEKHDHYTGMISLKQIDTEEDESWSKKDNWIIEEGYKAYYVIDGQQRLTTSIILIQAIISFCKAHNIEFLGNSSVEDIEKSFIKVTPKNSKYCNLYLLSYVKDDPSKNYLIYEIFENGSKPDLAETYYTLNLKKALESFTGRILSLYTKNNEREECIESLYRKLVNRFKFNLFLIENQFDVSVAFETMNNRGKKLSTLEILKNRLIYLTTIFTDVSEQDKDAIRNKINSAWAEIYTQIGRNKLAPLNDDDFLRNHWTMYFQYYKTKGINYITDLLNRRFTINSYFGDDVISYELIDLSEDEVDAENDDNGNVEYKSELNADVIIKYVDSLMDSAKYYYYVNNPNDTKEGLRLPDNEIVWLKRIKRLGYVNFTPMLMALLLHKDKIKPEKRIRIFKDIENMIFIIFRCCGYLGTYRANAFFTAARNLYETANADDCIKFLEDELNNVRPNFARFFGGKIIKLISDGGGFFKWNELRYFLFEYEQSLSTTNHNPSSIIETEYFKNKEKNDDTLSIEHILPQTIDKDCGYWMNAVRGFSDDEIKTLTNSLGNLLPLSQSINSSFQNDSFTLKKSNEGRQNRGYSNGSLSEREVALNDDWSPLHILSRGIKLLSFLEERWNVSFYNGDEVKGTPAYDDAKSKAIADFLNLQFVTIPRELPDAVEVIDEDGIDVYSNDNVKLKLSDISNYYFARLYYTKIARLLADKNIAFKAVRPTVGYVGLRRTHEDGKFSLFANIWFNSYGLRIDMNQPDGSYIGTPKGDGYSSNFKYAVKVDKDTDVEVVVNELINSFNVETEHEVSQDMIVDLINSKLEKARAEGMDSIEINAGDLQYELGLKKAAVIICNAMNQMKTDSDVIVKETQKRSLSYTIKYVL